MLSEKRMYMFAIILLASWRKPIKDILFLMTLTMRKVKMRFQYHLLCQLKPRVSLRGHYFHFLTD